jgi:hypothetical protein
MQNADPGLLSVSDAARLTAPAIDEPADAESLNDAPTPRRQVSAPSLSVDASDALAAEQHAPAPPRSSAPPLIEAAESAGEPARSRSAWPWLVLVAAVLLGGAWLVLRARATPAAQNEPAHAPTEVTAAKPTDQPTAAAPLTAPATPAVAETMDATPTPTEPEAESNVPPSVAAPSKRVRTPSPAVEERTEPAPATPPAEKRPVEPAASAAETERPEPARPAATTPFDKAAAVSALNNLAAQASACRQGADPSGMATVVLTFAPSGRVTSATVNGPPFAGTPTGGCVARTLRRAQVPAFLGDHVTVSKTVLVH